MSVFGQNVQTPLVGEASAVKATLPGPATTQTTVLANIASIHAVFIDVAVVCDKQVSSIDLVIYCAGKIIAAPVNIFTGVLAPNTPILIRYGGSLVKTVGPPEVGQAIGDCYDVIVTNDDPADALATVWTAARQ